jgi:putative MFS transporter
VSSTKTEEAAVLEHLERQTSLTNNQRKIVFAAILGDMLDFFDFYLIGFVLAFIVGAWHLTYGQSAMILLSSGLGAVPGALFWGFGWRIVSGGARSSS